MDRINPNIAWDFPYTHNDRIWISKAKKTVFIVFLSYLQGFLAHIALCLFTSFILPHFLRSKLGYFGFLKETVEAEVDQQADVSFFYLFHTLYHIITYLFRDIRLSPKSAAKLRLLFVISKKNGRNFYFIKTRIFWKISFFSKKSCIFAENFLDDGKV